MGGRANTITCGRLQAFEVTADDGTGNFLFADAIGGTRNPTNDGFPEEVLDGITTSLGGSLKTRMEMGPGRKMAVGMG